MLTVSVQCTVHEHKYSFKITITTFTLHVITFPVIFPLRHKINIATPNTMQRQLSLEAVVKGYFR